MGYNKGCKIIYIGCDRMIASRGNPDLLKSIQMGAKSVSESRGISKKEVPVPEGGAFNSLKRTQESVANKISSQVNSFMGNMNVQGNSPTVSSPSNTGIIQENIKFDYMSKLYESIYTLHDTREYFNAISSMFSLYAMGKLDESVLSNLSREDMREIKGIVREFKSILDVY